jgi:hypothetical protein
MISLSAFNGSFCNAKMIITNHISHESVSNNSKIVCFQESIVETILVGDLESYGDSNNKEIASLCTNECDIITCLNGEEILAKVTEIGIAEIRYKSCSNLDGPVYVIPKSKVLFIKYSNGSKEVISAISDSENFTKTKSDPRDDSKNLVSQGPEEGKLDNAMTSTAFVFAIISIFFLPFWIFAVIFGIIGLDQIQKNPNKYTSKSKKNGKSAVVIGLICAVLTAIVIALSL